MEEEGEFRWPVNWLFDVDLLDLVLRLMFLEFGPSLPEGGEALLQVMPLDAGITWQM